MKIIRTIIICALISSVIGCSTISSDNYVAKVNQPQIQAGDSATRESVKLNPAGWNKLNVTSNAAEICVNKSGDRTLCDGAEPSYSLLRANIINEGDSAAEVKWRCKFYLAGGIPIADYQNNQPAKDETGLGWHSMIVYPVKSKTMVDDENVIICVSPSTKTTAGKIEVHDLTNDVTIYNN